MNPSKIKTESLFIVVSGEGELISEHERAPEACTALARYFYQTRQEGAIYRKEAGNWVLY